MLKILVVEDERAAAEHLVGLLRRYEAAHSEQFEIVIKRSSFELFDDRRHYDVCLFDIDLPGISGMEAAELMRTYDSRAEIIFVTNLAKFAVRGYEVGAAGFIVKPATYSSLSLSLGRAINAVRSSARASILVNANDNSYVLCVNDLEYVESRGHDIIYHPLGGKPIKARGTLAALKEKLTDAPFFPASRSVLLNLDYVARITGNDVAMSSGSTIHLSRGRKKPLSEALAEHIGSGL